MVRDSFSQAADRRNLHGSTAPYFAQQPRRPRVLNVVHGLYPRAAVDERALEHVVALLNASRATFVGQGRTYHGGLEKFEPREMEALRLDLSE